MENIRTVQQRTAVTMGGMRDWRVGNPAGMGMTMSPAAYSSIGQQKELEAFGIREKMQRFLRFL